MACRILVPQLGIEPVSPALEAQSPNQWTPREFPPKRIFLMDKKLVFLETSN